MLPLLVFVFSMKLTGSVLVLAFVALLAQQPGLKEGLRSGLAMLAMGALLQQMGVDVERVGELKYTLRGSWDAPEMETVKGPATRTEAEERNK